MATGGSGKTMMMRHLFVDTINKTAHVPIFVELRELNTSELTLLQLINKKLHDNKFDFNDVYIEKAFIAGHFTLLLDGFDEVIESKRENVIKQIEEIADKYDQNYILLSSRPDNSLNKWTLFNVWEVQPLNLNLALELIEKTEADEDIKEKFTKALNDGLFEKHKSFLSNPLLLSIMLITYRESANIPHKISTFYERAYTALFEQHDARKAYHREKRTKLDISEFRKVFSAFCFLTYNKSIYSFSKPEVFDYLEKAQKVTGLDFRKEDFLNDAIQAVCLLVQDGMDITFSHRSFQEYFTALFVSQMNDIAKQERFLNSLWTNNTRFIGDVENIIELLFEIKPEIIEKAFIIPKLTELEKVIGYKSKFGESQHKALLKTLYSSMSIHNRINSIDSTKKTIACTIMNDAFASVISLVRHNYLSLNKTWAMTEKSDFFKLYKNQTKDSHGNSSIEDVLRKKTLYTALAEGNNWLSKKVHQQIFDIKTQLIEKHKKQEDFLEEELYT